MPQIPSNLQTRKITQLNSSNVLGDLWASFGIDLTENEGVIRFGKRLLLNTNTADVSQLTSYPVGFAAFQNAIFTAAGSSGTGNVFKNSAPYPSSGVFTRVNPGVTANAPADCDSTISDIIVSNDALYVTAASNTVYTTTNGSSWSNFTAGSGDSSNVHMMTSYAGRTYMTRAGSSIISWDAANTVATTGQYTLSLANTASNQITFLRASASRIWIGTLNRLGGKGYIYEWDGSTSSPTKAYRLEAQGALSCVIKDDVPYVIDSNGSLIAWNGGTFKTITGFNRRKNKMLYNASTSTVNNRFIHPNGMSLVDGDVSIFIDGRNYDDVATQEETIPSGVWEYTDTHGLVHQSPISALKFGGTQRDLGQVKIAGAGALSEMNIANSSSGRNGTFIVGATYFTDASNTSSGIFYDDSIDSTQKGGYFITTKLRPDPLKTGAVITGLFRKLFIAYRKFLNSTDRMVIKVRTAEAEPLTNITISWPNSTQFNSTTDLTSAGYVVGDEVEILQGEAAGYCAHITAMGIYSGGIMTVTIDETMPVTGLNNSVARFQKWVKLFEINDQTTTWAWMGVSNLAANWVQFKVWMACTGQNEIEQLAVVDSTAQIAE